LSQLKTIKKGYKIEKGYFGKGLEIPEDWEIKTFDELFDFLISGTNGRDDLDKNGEIHYIHYGDIHKNKKLILDCDLEKIPYISKDKVSKIPLLKDADLIIADASEDYGGSGASILLTNVKNKKIVSGLHTIVLRNKDESISVDFKGYVTLIPSVKSQIISYVTGMSVYGLSKSNLKGIKVPIPKDPKEGMKIGKILSNVYKTIQKTQELIDQTIVYRESLMQKILIQGITHAKPKKQKWYFGKSIEIPEDWDIKPLGEIAKLSAGGTPSTSKKEYWENGTIPWLTSGEINFNRITNSEQKITKLGLDNSAARIFPKNCVLIAITGFGMTRGRSSYLEIESTTNQSVVGIIPEKEIINAEYLWYYLRKEYFLVRSFAQGTQQPGLNLEILNDFLVRYPKDPKEGIKIGNILSNIDKKIKCEKKYKKQMESYHKSLMQKILTGQKRVKF